MDALDGKEPMYVLPPKPSDASETFLDEAGFNFIAKCLQVLESRGQFRIFLSILTLAN